MAKAPVPRKTAAGTPPQYMARIRVLQRRLKKLHLDALLVTNPRDIRYLTGFAGDDSWALVQGSTIRVHVISDSRFEEQLQIEAPHVTAHIRKDGLSEELERIAEDQCVGRVGLQSAHVTLSQRKGLEKKLGAECLKDVEEGLIDQRAVKDKDEVAAIRAAADIQQEAFKRLLKVMRPGQTENQVAALLDYEMRCLGAQGPSFPTIVAAGANASLPHAVPGEAKLRRNDIVLIDWGARYRGYCSDMTRVVAFGKMPPAIREIYPVVLEAQQAGIDAIKPGALLKMVDAAARQVIEKAGFGDRFGHGLGHGIGLNIHELPRLSRQSKGELAPGNVVTVEPGIYLPGVGGVRIEDDVLVTRRGKKVLTHLPKDLNWAII